MLSFHDLIADSEGTLPLGNETPVYRSLETPMHSMERIYEYEAPYFQPATPLFVLVSDPSGDSDETLEKPEDKLLSDGLLAKPEPLEPVEPLAAELFKKPKKVKKRRDRRSEPPSELFQKPQKLKPLLKWRTPEPIDLEPVRRQTRPDLLRWRAANEKSEPSLAEKTVEILKLVTPVVKKSKRSEEKPASVESLVKEFFARESSRVVKDSSQIKSKPDEVKESPTEKSPDDKVKSKPATEKSPDARVKPVAEKFPDVRVKPATEKCPNVKVKSKPATEKSLAPTEKYPDAKVNCKPEKFPSAEKPAARVKSPEKRKSSYRILFSDEIFSKRSKTRQSDKKSRTDDPPDDCWTRESSSPRWSRFHSERSESLLDPAEEFLMFLEFRARPVKIPDCPISYEVRKREFEKVSEEVSEEVQKYFKSKKRPRLFQNENWGCAMVLHPDPEEYAYVLEEVS